MSFELGNRVSPHQMRRRVSPPAWQLENGQPGYSRRMVKFGDCHGSLGASLAMTVKGDTRTTRTQRVECMRMEVIATSLTPHAPRNDTTGG